MSCHRDTKLDAMLNKKVELVLFDGSHYQGILYDRKSAMKLTGEILGNTPYFLMLNGGCFGFYKTHVKKIKCKGAKP